MGSHHGDTPLVDQLVRVWRTNHRVTRLLLDQIDDEGLLCTLSRRGGRTVGRQLGHLHYVRIHHLQKRAKRLAAGAELFASKEEPVRGALERALEDSAERIERFIREVDARAAGVRSFRRGLVQHVAYFVAHESHHRGNILLTLKHCERPVDARVRNGIWDWDRI